MRPTQLAPVRYTDSAKSEAKTPTTATTIYRDDPNAPIDPICGFALDSFACRIRHIQINTGVAKAAG